MSIILWHPSPFDVKSYQSNVNIYALFHWHSSPLHLIYFLMFFISPQNATPLFFNDCPQRKTLSDDWINSLFFILFITYTVVIHMMYNRVLYIWSWFFPVTVLYMILILPRHCLIYDPDSTPSLSYIWSWFFPATVLYMILILPRHCLIYDPDSSPPLSYIWSWFFPATVLYMILILPRHCLIYDPDSSPSLSYIWSWFFPVTVLYMIMILPRQYQITPI